MAKKKIREKEQINVNEKRENRKKVKLNLKRTWQVYNLLNGIANLSEYMKSFSLSSSRIYEIIYDDE